MTSATERGHSASAALPFAAMAVAVGALTTAYVLAAADSTRTDASAACSVSERMVPASRYTA
jgi:hypothetical protein